MKEVKKRLMALSSLLALLRGPISTKEFNKKAHELKSYNDLVSSSRIIPLNEWKCLLDLVNYIIINIHHNDVKEKQFVRMQQDMFNKMELFEYRVNESIEKMVETDKL